MKDRFGVVEKKGHQEEGTADEGDEAILEGSGRAAGP